MPKQQLQQLQKVLQIDSNYKTHAKKKKRFKRKLIRYKLPITLVNFSYKKN